MLVATYRGTGGLHGPPAQLYETALLGLADEPDRDRDAAPRTRYAEQILAVGARLCCYLLLCGRARLLDRPAAPHACRVPGAPEPGWRGGAPDRRPIQVTSGLIDAALNSALFTTRGPGRRAPAHATFAACLAARHLAAHDLPDPQLRSLLTMHQHQQRGHPGAAGNSSLAAGPAAGQRGLAGGR